MRNDWQKRQTQNKLKLIGLSFLLVLCAVMLSACASPPGVVECPEPEPVPASLVSDKSEIVSDYLERVQAYLKKAANWSENLTQTGKR